MYPLFFRLLSCNLTRVPDESMSDILFIKTSSLGDVIHQMPAVTEARRWRRHARFAWVVEEAFAPLVRLHPAVDEVIPVAARRWRSAAFAPRTWREISGFVAGLRKHDYDEIVDSQGLFFKSALIARLARGRRHGYDATSIRERAASSLYDVQHRVARGLHAIARNRILTGLALGYAPDGGVDFGLEREKLANRGGSYGILLHATARAQKEWPEASWMALGRALDARRGSLTVPWGTPAERLRSERIAAAVAGALVPDRRCVVRHWGRHRPSPSRRSAGCPSGWHFRRQRARSHRADRTRADRRRRR
jgi:heptosyltransferase-1